MCMVWWEVYGWQNKLKVGKSVGQERCTRLGQRCCAACAGGRRAQDPHGRGQDRHEILVPGSHDTRTDCARGLQRSWCFCLLGSFMDGRNPIPTAFLISPSFFIYIYILPTSPAISSLPLLCLQWFPPTLLLRLLLLFFYCYYYFIFLFNFLLNK